MHRHSHSHKDGNVVLREADLVPVRESAATADLLGYIADIDARKLYAQAGYSSIHAYCVERMHLSEDAAYKRIHAARAALEFPVLFVALAENRIHLAAIGLLAPHLNAENVDDLIAVATHKSKAEVAKLVAERFQQRKASGPAEALIACSLSSELAPGQVGSLVDSDEQASGPSNRLAPGQVDAPPAKEAKDDARHALEVLREKIEYAQSLMSHRVSHGNALAVMNRAMDDLIAKLERQKFGATTRPRCGRASKNPRHVPAAVKRAVWTRDGGRCTFVSDDGHRCGSRQRLEFDHVEPVARGGGGASVGGIRLRCRTHNQYEAERVYGASFMQHKREQAKRETEARAHARARAEEVIPWLLQLKVRPADARRAAARCEGISEASLEERVRMALRHVGPAARPVSP